VIFSVNNTDWDPKYVPGILPNIFHIQWNDIPYGYPVTQECYIVTLRDIK
jgi:hypothetical protein